MDSRLPVVFDEDHAVWSHRQIGELVVILSDERICLAGGKKAHRSHPETRRH